jgi:hypothetical protein
MKSFVVIFIPYQLTMSSIVERRWDYVRLMYDLLNDTTLTRKIVVCSVFSVTEILIIKDHKLKSTFLHVAFGSQRLLKQTSD